MPFDIAKYWLDEAQTNGCKLVGLSGGETLCYPHLYEVISYAKKRGLRCAAAFSGVGFTAQVYHHLIHSGLDEIHISLNGSTLDINSQTRDGYEDAISALSIIKGKKECVVAINWVMHSNNCKDFPNLLCLAEEYEVDYIQVIGFKPDAKNELPSLPKKKQMYAMADIINSYHGNTKIVIESCYSQLRALVYDNGFWGNYNVGVNKGCLAGTRAVNIGVNGMLSPCRHLMVYEGYKSISEYFLNSPVIKAIHEAAKKYESPCAECHYRGNCRHCIATSYCMRGKLIFGDQTCPIASDENTYVR